MIAAKMLTSYFFWLTDITWKFLEKISEWKLGEQFVNEMENMIEIKYNSF